MKLQNIENPQRVLLSYAAGALENWAQIIADPSNDASVFTGDLVSVANFTNSIALCEAHQITLMEEIIQEELDEALQVSLQDYIDQTVIAN